MGQAIKVSYMTKDQADENVGHVNHRTRGFNHMSEVLAFLSKIKFDRFIGTEVIIGTPVIET